MSGYDSEFELKALYDEARDAALETAERLALSVRDRPGSHYVTVGLAEGLAGQMRLVHRLRREHALAVSG